MTAEFLITQSMHKRRYWNNNLTMLAYNQRNIGIRNTVELQPKSKLK